MSSGIYFTQRDFSTPAIVPGVTMKVEYLEWRAVGGPWQARVRVDSDSLARLWYLVDLLRCEMVIGDEAAAYGMPASYSGPSLAGPIGPAAAAAGVAWWGYVSGVEIHAQARVVRVSLDEMANRVAVRYRQVVPGGAVEEEAYTSWYEDTESIALYGEKEKVFYIGEATAADAAAYAAAMRNEIGKPVMKARVDPERVPDAGLPPGGPGLPAGYYAVLEGRGWWDTVGWRYYHETRGKLENLYEGAEQNLGSNSVNTRLGQTFSHSDDRWKVKEVWVPVKKLLTADNLTLQVCIDSAGVPSTVMDSVSLASSVLDESMKWRRFLLPYGVMLASGSPYWLVLRRSGSVSGSNYYTVSVEEGLHASGVLRLYDGSVWSARLTDADLTYMMWGVEESSEQVRRMLLTAAGGQFMTATDMLGSSGIETRLYREGKRNAREEIEELLMIGVTSGGRLLARVTQGRRAQVYAVPDEDSAEVSIGEDGRIEHIDGRPMALSEQPAGQWAELGGLSTAGGLLGYAGAVFIERAYWDGKVLRYGD